MTDERIDPLLQAERLNKLGEVIESRPEQFDMSWWFKVPDWKASQKYNDDTIVFHNVTTPDGFATFEIDMLAEGCDTRGCVAGWACTLFEFDLDSATRCMDTGDAAAQLLGLDCITQEWLFDEGAKHQEAEQAAEVLRELAAYVVVHGETNGFVSHWEYEHRDD